MRPERMRVSRRGLAVTLAATLVALQFLRPDLAGAPARRELAVPPAVRELLRGACYDCHSTETRLRWFDRVVPAYWLVARDVE